METKHTAVEFLQEQYYESQGKLTRKDFEQAKAIEKEQIIEAHFEGWGNAYDYLKDENSEARQAQDYYEETYGK